MSRRPSGDDDILLHAVAIGGDQLVLGRNAHFATLQVGAADAQDADFAFAGDAHLAVDLGDDRL
ncbi:MAG: hypothetical protein KDE24_26460, partial [Caldilinea sp.]|nr:hypothetical protein [Caldilinea sp.]